MTKPITPAVGWGWVNTRTGEIHPWFGRYKPAGLIRIALVPLAAARRAGLVGKKGRK